MTTNVSISPSSPIARAASIMVTLESLPVDGPCSARSIARSAAWATCGEKALNSPGALVMALVASPMVLV